MAHWAYLTEKITSATYQYVSEELWKPRNQMHYVVKYARRFVGDASNIRDIYSISTNPLISVNPKCFCKISISSTGAWPTLIIDRDLNNPLNRGI